MLLPKPTKVPQADLDLLKNFLQQQGHLCIHPADGDLPHAYVTPTAAVHPGQDDRAAVPERSSVGHYLQMYDWDACFFSQAGARLGRPDLPLAVVRNFLNYDTGSGQIPRTVSPRRIWDKGDQCKPFLCQTLLATTGGTNLDDAVIDGLDRYLGYYIQHRRHVTGLYRWRNVLESGVDNNLALLAPMEAAKDENTEHTAFPDGQLLACDLSAYLFAEFQAFAKIASGNNRTDLEKAYRARADELRLAIDSLLWSDKLSLYCNLDPDTLTHVELRSWTGLVPVITGAANSERVREVIECNITSDEHFLRPAGVASVAASERLCNQARRGLYGRVLVSNWQGPMWVLPNVMVARCLTANGYHEAAQVVASRVVSTLAADVRRHGSLHENYNAETGEALFASRFMSWNILALELIDLLQQ